MRINGFQLKRYYWQISRRLSCPVGRKRQIMGNIRSGVNDFLLEEPDADMAAVMEHFGTPEQIVESYLSEMDPKELQKSLNVRKRIFTVVLIAVLAALAMWAIVMIDAAIDAQNSVGGYYEVIVNEGEDRYLGLED